MATNENRRSKEMATRRMARNVTNGVFDIDKKFVLPNCPKENALGVKISLQIFYTHISGNDV